MSEIGKKIDYVVRVGLGPVLRAAGFTRKGRTFHRRNAESVSVTNVQGSSWNVGDAGRFTINLGVYFPAVARLNGEAQVASPAEYQCHCRERIGQLLPNPRDRWWEISQATDLDALAAKVGRLWAEHAPNWFARRETPAGAAASFLARGDYQNAALVSAAAGDTRAAQAALDRAFEAERADDRRIEWLERLGRRLRLAVPEAPVGPRWGVQGPHWYTEEAWEACENPHHVLGILKQRGSDSSRKLRLAGVACCRAAWDTVTTDELKAMEAIEGYADKVVKQADMRETTAALVNTDHGRILHHHAAQKIGRQTAAGVVSWLLGVVWYGPRLDNNLNPVQKNLAPRLTARLRDIFGNPFRPLPFPKAWRTAAVVGLARGIYDERAFDRLPILADALEEAGCDNADVLAHCRGDGPHVRGCWVLDGVLGLK